jgi:transposase
MQILCVALLVFGVERKKIKEALGAADSTLCKYAAAIRGDEIESIFQQNYRRPQSDLEEHREQIEAEFEKTPPATRREAAIAIERITGMKRGLTQIGKFLKKGGLKAGR